MYRLSLVLRTGNSTRVRTARRCYSSAAKRGLVLGIYQENNDHVLTTTARRFDEKSGGKISQVLPLIKNDLSLGRSHVLLDPQLETGPVALVGLGSSIESESNVLEGRNEQREAVRIASAAGVTALRGVGCDSIEVDGCGDAAAAAEGATLELFTYEEMKNPKDRRKPVSVDVHGDSKEKWQKGVKYAEGQNFARKLMETPANHLTPTLLGQQATDVLKSVGVNVSVRDEAWCRNEGMTAFMSVAKGSCEPPAFIHATYCPEGLEKSNPLCLVGKGVTFDSGGICLKNLHGMDLMRGDMGGAAVTLGTLYAVAALKIPLHVQAFVPACENMPGHQPNRPGDVVLAMNGKSIRVVDTDYEGRLILADALCYAQKITQPRLIVDMATLTLEAVLGLGSSATATYTGYNAAWEVLEAAGYETGDRMWRMPLWNHYSKQMTEGCMADVSNVGSFLAIGGSCTAAAFLKEFVSIREWVHLDIAGVMQNKGEVPYLGTGMSGRPTRTLVKMAEVLSSRSPPSKQAFDSSMHAQFSPNNPIPATGQ